MKLFKNLIWNVSAFCYAEVVIIIEILISLPVLLWAPTVWLSQWIMYVIQGSTDNTVFYDIAYWYVDKILINYTVAAVNLMEYIFLGKENTENDFRELIYERLGI